MSGNNETWVEYLNAARRKLHIAKYHLGKLEVLVRPDNHSQEQIAIQAHFEGVLFAVIAAADQIAEAINLAQRLGLKNPNLRCALDNVEPSEVFDKFSRWWNEPIIRDVRNIRRLATHHHYKKKPPTNHSESGGLVLEVEQPQGSSLYRGSRELTAYSRAVVEAAKRLEPLLIDLERQLSKGD